MKKTPLICAILILPIGWLNAAVLIDFFPEIKIRPKQNPYPLVISGIGSEQIKVRTNDRSRDVPGLTGAFDAGQGTIGITLDGRGVDSSKWNPATWSGGDSHLVKGSEDGLGIDSGDGTQKVDGGEAIVWSFDLSQLKLKAGESLVLTGADFGGIGEGERAEFWKLSGGPGAADSGTRISQGGIWKGELDIADGDQFAVSGKGRLRSMTLGITSEALRAAALRNTSMARSTESISSVSMRDPSAPLPPNIIVVLADDMAWYDTPVRMDAEKENSAQEIMRSLKDPGNPDRLYRWNLQRMAEDGVIFSNAYSAAPQCTPTRGALQTGMTTARNRLGVQLGGKGVAQYDGKPDWEYFPIKPNGVRIPFPEEIQTIPEVLAPFGYQCAHYGKWHLGSDPAVEGYVESDGMTDNNHGKTYDSSDRSIPVDFENAKRIKEMTDKTIAFMTKQNRERRPFYVQLSHYAVHSPWECKRSSRELFQNHPDVVAYNNGERDPAKLNRKSDPAVFFGMLYELDLSIGRLMTELERLDIADNTYLIFKSDNGYRRFDTQNFTQPFFGRKWFLWQAGLRVPMIVKGPGIPGGRVIRENVVTYDLLPTFYDWAGGDTARLTEMDGISLKGLLKGKDESPLFMDRSLYFHYPYYRAAIPLSVVVKGNHKLLYSYDATIRTDISVSDPRLLFDLEKDPGEFHNLTSKHPELARSLHADLNEYLNSVEAWRPLDNTGAYLADGGKQFEAEDGAERRDLFAPFEGSRMPSKRLNDGPLSSEE